MQRLFNIRVMKETIMSWRAVLEDSRVMKSVLNRLILSLFDGLTKEHCIAVHLFWKSCAEIGKKSGWLFLALYLKQSRVCLQRYVAGDTIPNLSVFVSLTGRGLPRIIPSFHRTKIRNGDDNIVRMYMSLFSLSKLIALAARVKPSLFSSIITPADLDKVSEVAAEMRASLGHLLRRYVPGIDKIPMKQGLEFTPVWKSVPSINWYKSYLATHTDNSGKRFNKELIQKTSVMVVLPYELAAFQFLLVFVHKGQDHFSQGALWAPYIRYAFDHPGNSRISELSLEWFEKRIGPYLPSCDALGVPPNTGRLCQSLSGDGKRRLFAIGNYINQRLLEPVHRWLAEVLRRIPMDGTFNQTAPLDRMKGLPGTIHSVDLKSATDRWPLLLLFELVQALFSRSFASSVVNSTLATNIFDVSFTRQRMSVSFVAGQPLGYLSSWPLFALSHHVMLWWAAEQVNPGSVFTKYAILGDDVVIADDAVKAEYSKLLERLGVQISAAKSITSPSGACEFAKKFRLDHMTRDVSPVSVKKVLETFTLQGWSNFIQTSVRPLRLSTKYRLAGLGYKAAARPFASARGAKARRLNIMLIHQQASKIGLYLALSSAIGKWISPQVIGRLVHMLLEHFKPQDPIPPPLELFAYPGMADFNEYGMYRSWMKQYLKYLQWHCLAFMEKELSLDYFLDVPIYIHTWHRPLTDIERSRYGFMLRLYDEARILDKRGICAIPEYVSDHVIQGEGFILFFRKS